MQTRRNALVGALAATVAPAGALTADIRSPDPIYATIETHSAAVAAYAAATDATLANTADDAADALATAAYETWDAAADVLRETVPTTMAGIVALLDHLHQIELDHEQLIEWDDEFHATILGNVRLALKNGLSGGRSPT